MIKKILLGLILLCSPVLAGDREDPVETIKRKITKAEETYAIELAKAQAETIKWLDGREATARKKGDKTVINTVKLQREKLETEGIIPKPCPVSVNRKIDTARDMLDASYVSLMKDALVAKLDDLADELETKHIELLKDKPTFKLVTHMAKNLVENGSFEWPEVPQNLKFVPMTNNNGWKADGFDVVRFPTSTPVHGSQMIQMVGEITQTISGLIPGERYTLTVYAGTYAMPAAPNPTCTVTIGIAGEKDIKTVTANNAGSKTGYAMTGTTNAKWEQLTLVFKALGETHELSIKGEISSQHAQNVVIDQVSILPYLGN
jgi:hypothetical protein